MPSTVSTTTMPRPLVTPDRLELAGAAIVRWSIVLLLLGFGALKWTQPEAAAIAPFLTNSPLFAWLIPTFGQQGASEFIGVIELVVAALIALRHWSPRLAMIGGLLASVMFLTTLSFIVTTPGVGEGVPFLLKDLPLLGGALWTAGESWAALSERAGR